MHKTPFLEKIENSILVCDGAMGTMIYTRGIFINRCFDELNLSNPSMIKSIHQDYVAARADIIETNTFGANPVKLKHHGIDDKVHLINKRGAELAKEAAGDGVYVAGSMGPLGILLEPLGKLTVADAKKAYIAQAEGLVDGGIDVFMLETFADLNELALAVEVLREISDLPIIAQITFSESRKSILGNDPKVVVETLTSKGADVIGANCSVGPQPMLEVIENMVKAGGRFISAQPNAGNPRIVDNRLLYMSTPEYHAEFAKRFISAGARIVGGCCGTTPDHIKAIVNAVRAIQPQKSVKRVEIKPDSDVKVDIVQRQEKSKFARRLDEKFAVSVEVLSPRGVDATAVLNGIQKLAEFGVDVVNIPDGPRASSRMSPMALAQLIERSLPIETILHYCCRDRNLLGMQSDLLGAYALGLRNILAITGDPPKLGDYPDATGVFDVDAIGLTRIIHNLNHGFDVAGNPIGKPTGWHIGVGANPGAMDIELEINRLYKKVDGGAEYILTQPVYDITLFSAFLDRISDIQIPILAGIMPLMSYRTVEFLNNEVPGVFVPDSIGKKLLKAKDSEDAKRVGIDIAQQAILDVKNFDKVKGIYFMPPFVKGKYDITIEILNILNKVGQDIKS